ncbi:MAG: MFS transporter [Clostridia bacterium]|nr:MFS transporter [Clostridia bacterium]
MERRYVEDEKQSVILFLVLWVLYAVVYMTKNCYSAAMATLVSEGVLTKTQTGTINASFYLIYAIFQIIGGIAADKFSPAKLILLGIVGAAFANLAVYFNQNYTFMLVIWSLNAAVQFGVWPGIFKIVATQLAPAHRQKGIFYILMACSFGLIFSYICAAVVEKWQSNFIISAVSLFVLAVVWFFTYHNAERYMVTEAPREVKRKGEQKKSAGLMKLMFTSGVIFLLISCLGQNVLNLGIKSLTPVMIMESYDNISPSLATGLNTILIVINILGLFAARRFVLRRFSDETISMTIFYLLALPFVVLIAFVGKLPAFLMILALSLVAALMAAAGLNNSYICARFNQYGYTGTMSGIFNAVAAFSIVIANFAFTRLADSAGWTVTTLTWIIIAVLTLLLNLAAIPLWRRMIRES